jgi:hypothetical protein
MCLHQHNHPTWQQLNKERSSHCRLVQRRLALVLPGKKTLPKRVVSPMPSHHRRRRRGYSAHALHFPFRANGARASSLDKALHAICFCPLHPKSCCLRTLGQAAAVRFGEMWQQEKLAVAAVEELLKADLSRQRKTAAAQSRKGSASRRKERWQRRLLGRQEGELRWRLGRRPASRGGADAEVRRGSYDSTRGGEFRPRRTYAGAEHQFPRRVTHTVSFPKLQ